MNGEALDAAAIADPKPRRDPVGYYERTAEDFRPWSAAGNMHFGFHCADTELFDRETQTAQMTVEVGRRLGLAADADARVVDFGCGTGAPLRQLLEAHPGWRAVGLSNVQCQVDAARDAAKAARLNHRMTVLCEDFRNTSFPPARFDGLIAIEAFCYGTGFAKHDVLREAKRLLRPGARLVIADAFLQDMRALPGYLGACHEHICQGWQIDTLACRTAVDKSLRELGFCDVAWEDVSMNVAPSMLHVPGVSTGYIGELIARAGLNDIVRLRHATAPLAAMVLGLARRHFGYYLLTARRG